MDDKTAFHPEPAATVHATFTDVTGTVTLAGVVGASKAVRLVNKGPNDVFINFGPAGQVATLASAMLFPAGQTEVFQPGLATTLAGICAGGETATVYATTGVGM